MVTKAAWLSEPVLTFADGHTHADAKVGIALWGPRSLATPRHPGEVKVGFIGTARVIEACRELLSQASGGVSGEGLCAPFPGCQPDRGFRCSLRVDDEALVSLITRNEHDAVLAIKGQRERFEHFLALLLDKLRGLSETDHRLDYVLVALPDDLYKRCRVADYRQDGKPVHRDLRRAFKARAMEFRLPTQILLERTATRPRGVRLDHPAEVAWNLLTGLYFKAGGLPWGPAGLKGGSCYVGISFFRPLGEDSTLRTSVVQAFDEEGEGLVLRGHDFHWDDRRQGRTPHLSEELAGALIEMVLERYQKERGRLPRRVVVHKTSGYADTERAGFRAGLGKVDQYDLLALRPTSAVRLMRSGRYPPLRGTVFSIGEVSYLYTVGYLPELTAYPHGHVPSPLEISEHVGDSTTRQLLGEVMTLTKMNWNAADYAERDPITVRFSRLVGDVLREVPAGLEPQPNYRYYM